MDPLLIREHLVEAERHIALSDMHIARQVAIIDELDRGSHSTLLAVDLLHTYRMMRATHLAHRDLIRRELEVMGEEFTSLAFLTKLSRVALHRSGLLAPLFLG